VGEQPENKASTGSLLFCKSAGVYGTHVGVDKRAIFAMINEDRKEKGDTR
jgi:hypothetical protein